MNLRTSVSRYRERQQRNRRVSQYLGEDGDWHGCEVLEVNGRLIYVEDVDTGHRDWYAPHELR